MPLVSVIIPTYNRLATLREAVRSALDQTHPEMEVIVVDDQSNDETAAVMAEWASREPRLLFHRIEEKGRASVCRNKGLELAKGEFVTFLDDDDLLRPDKTAKQLLAIGSADLCAGQTEIFHEHPGDTGLVWNTFAGPDPLLRFAALETVWGTAAPLWRTESIRKIGAWDTTLPFHQDLETHLRALVQGLKAVLIPDVVVDYRDAPTGRMTTNRKKGVQCVLIELYERTEVANMGLDLRRAFATTYGVSAGAAAKNREWSAAWRSLGDFIRVEPSIGHKLLALPLALFIPLVYAAGTGAALPTRLLALCGRRWKPYYGIHRLENEPGKLT